MKIRRGTLYITDLSPHRGTEPGKTRPVLVVQTDLLNGHHPSTLVCPLTTNVRKSVKYLRLHLSKGEAGLDEDSDVLLDQLRAIDNRRIIKALGSLSDSAIQSASEKLAVILDLFIERE